MHRFVSAHGFGASSHDVGVRLSAGTGVTNGTVTAMVVMESKGNGARHVMTARVWQRNHLQGEVELALAGRRPLT
ncbi:hypothetical protein [Oleiagrimonas sp. C23AA]|uniref:hypothetical protein n=1 Tax=Oleiagrimonas sp. C23AA TaxID=2719047 RepID=UPI0014232D01|nr:hypothetical protein [Oleiagrimonas sp. C23AA]